MNIYTLTSFHVDHLKRSSRDYIMMSKHRCRAMHRICIEFDMLDLLVISPLVVATPLMQGARPDDKRKIR
jgi:hypothetical protein